MGAAALRFAGHPVKPAVWLLVEVFAERWCSVDASRLFVFAGAGVSMSAPTHLPGFNALRSAILADLGLADFIANGPPRTDQQIAADGIAPEPFFAALTKGDVDVGGWLSEVLGNPSVPYNAAHQALAELCLCGAHVWTVNFDPFIERSASDTALQVTSWPEPPSPIGLGELLKPHGSLGGRLTVTPEDVLRPVDPAWLTRFRVDIAASDTVILLGYSGRDYDFQGQWEQAITTQTVLWFDFPDRGDGDRDRMRRLFATADTAGRLTFPPPAVTTAATDEERINPCRDFVLWCREHHFVASVTDNQLDQTLTTSPAHPTFPRWRGNRSRARAHIATKMNAPRRAALWTTAWALGGPGRLEALDALGSSVLNRPSPVMRLATSLWRTLPETGRFAPTRIRLRQAWLLQLSNAARHDEVLANTQAPTTGDMFPDEWPLRTAALKMTGHVEAAIAEARAFVESQDSPTAPADLCTACFHWCHGLLWAGRYDEARQVLSTHFRPAASITDARWMAWADYVEACMLAAGGANSSADQALALAQSAAPRFASEGNSNGRITALTVKLTALRKAGRTDDYHAAAETLLALVERRPPFARQAVTLEYSQGLAHLDGDVEAARRMIGGLVDSSFLVHRGLASVLAGQWAPTAAASDQGLEAAHDIARSGGLGLLQRACEDLLNTPFGDRRKIQIFYP